MSANVVVGSAMPRLFTPELRKLTPKTTRGFEVIAFALSLGIVLLPWQEEFLKRALEIHPDGTFRFRTVLLLVSRQNGKTTVARVLALWLMTQRAGSMVLGTSTSIELAREPFYAVADDAEGMGLVQRVTRGSIDTSLWLHNGSRYKVASASRRGGRSLSVDLLLVDELREQTDDWDAWNALSATTTARPDPLTLAMSNAGDERSVVLNGLRASALAGDDQALGIFEWSAPDGCELDDVEALALANPALGHTITLATLETKRNTLPPGGYRTEHLCQHVESIDPAIDKEAWNASADPTPMSEQMRKRVCLALDVSPDLRHVSLVAAAQLDDGRTRVETVAAWSSTEEARQALPELLERIKPRKLGWFPAGPAAALRADLAKIKCSVEITDAVSTCQGFSEQVSARRIIQSGDPMLTAQAIGASKVPSGDGWRFTRKGAGHVDAVYAAAGAVHLVRSQLTQVGKPRILLAREQ